MFRRSPHLSLFASKLLNRCFSLSNVAGDFSLIRHERGAIISKLYHKSDNITIGQSIGARKESFAHKITLRSATHRRVFKFIV